MPRRRGPPETGQLGEFLRDPRLGDESALATPDLDEAALDQILDRLPHSRAADFELLDHIRVASKQELKDRTVAARPRPPRRDQQCLILSVLTAITRHMTATSTPTLDMLPNMREVVSIGPVGEALGGASIA